MTEIGSVIDGKYEILKELGRGGMSVVYLAMDKHLNKQWAVKEIRKKGKGENDEIIVNSLLAEANLMKKLDHPALPRIVDIIDNGITIYVVMDYIEGESLDKIIKDFGAQSEEMVINWAKQICDTLSYLHSQHPPIIYRDMKPANIMLKPEGNIKIIDFGIAREYKEQNLSDTTVLGTKGYAPPEQYSGQTDPRSDIYALGMTMHHLLTGVDPRSGEAYAPVRMYNPELSEGIELIIDRCVQPAAENRYQSCEDLLYDLEFPELITRGFKKKQKKKLWSFLGCTILSAVMLVTGVASSFAASRMNKNEYENLILQSDPKQIEQAIEIYPQRFEAYNNMLNLFEDGFSHKEYQLFNHVYEANQNKLKEEDPAQYAELNFNFGILCFNAYKNSEGQPESLPAKVSRSRSYFEKNNAMADVDYEHKKTSQCYYDICRFYQEFISTSSSSVNDASKEDFEKLLVRLNEAIDSVGEANAYNKLMVYDTVITIINEYSGEMAQVKINQDELIEMIDRVKGLAEKLTVRKPVARELQQYILENYSVYKGNVNTSYETAQKRELLNNAEEVKP